jgi:hypothetical protein
MATLFDPEKVSDALRALHAFAMPDAESVQELRADARSLKRLLRDIQAAQQRLLMMERALDAVMVPGHVFDLTNPETVGEVIIYKLERQPKEQLSAIRPFYGSGVYILYYHDGLKAYEAITKTDCPIYVGSAGPESANAASPKLQG